MGVLGAGDRVDVYGGFQVQSPSGTSVPVMRLLIPNALVLRAGAGQGASLGSSGGQGANVLLAVDDAQAGTLAFASDNGKVWLVLRPTNAANATRDITSIGSVLFNTKSSLSGSVSVSPLNGSNSVLERELEQLGNTGGRP